MNKGAIQESQYAFPYHYLPHLDADGRAYRGRYLKWGYEYLCYHQHVRETVAALQPQSIVEVGCGDGSLIGSLTVAERRVGVDISKRAIAFAQAFHPEVDFRANDAAELSESFDVVLAAEVLEHIPDEGVSRFLKTLERLAKPGGHVVISVPSIVQRLNKKHYRHYCAKMLTTQVQEAAPNLRLERLDDVFAPARWFRWLAKMTCNRNFILEVPAVNRLLWRHASGRARHGAPGKGRHLVAIFTKRATAPSV